MESFAPLQSSPDVIHSSEHSAAADEARFQETMGLRNVSNTAILEAGDSWLHSSIFGSPSDAQQSILPMDVLGELEEIFSSTFRDENPTTGFTEIDDHLPSPNLASETPLSTHLPDQNPAIQVSHPAFVDLAEIGDDLPRCPTQGLAPGELRALCEERVNPFKLSY